MPNLPISQLPPISASTLGYLSSDAEFAVAQSVIVTGKQIGRAHV